MDRKKQYVQSKLHVDPDERLRAEYHTRFADSAAKRLSGDAPGAD